MIKIVLSKFLTGLILLAFLPLNGISQNPEDLFPEVEGWTLEVGDRVYDPDNLWDLINGAADAYLSYDFRKLFTAEYSNNMGHTIKVYTFKHADPTNAFGIYSQERNPDYEFLDIGSQGFASPGALYFIKGPYYIQLSTNDKQVFDQFKSLAIKLDKSLNVEASTPKELNLFPEQGKVDYSEKFISEDFLGYSFLHSAFVADYKKEGKAFQIFILAPENKEEIGTMLNEFLDKQDYPREKREQDIIRVDAKYIGSILFYNSGDYLFGIKGADKSIEKEYLQNIKEME